MARRLGNAVKQMVRTLRDRGPLAAATLSRYYIARALAVVSGPGRRCPVCEWSGRDFHPMVLVEDAYVRRGVICPSCLSRERQRAFAPAVPGIIERHFGDRAVDVLEFAPDSSVTRQLRPFARTYRGSNYVSPGPDELQLDLHAISLPPDSVDLVVFTYVLCCVPDDRLSVANLWRILRPGGMVAACEAFSPTGEHVEYHVSRHGGTWRQYGVGNVALRFAPFEVEVLDLTSGLDPSERVRRGLRHPEYALILRKPAGPSRADDEAAKVDG